MSDPLRQRVRLWLRSEQALGLSAVAAPSSHGEESIEMAPSPLAEMPPQARAPAQARASVNRLGRSTTQVVQEGAAASESLVLPSGPAFARPVLPLSEKRLALTTLDQAEVTGCVRCRLHETRTQTVFGEGDPDAKVFFIGEGPGENEDMTGRPFVGRAGALLDKMIVAMGLTRQRVFITNIVKCRPPGNREPAPDEVATCTPYLLRQLEIIRPQIIVTLGRPASQYMLQSKLPMSRLRGQWHAWRGIKLMPTYHPAYVLRNYTEQTRAAVWSDLKQVMAEVGLGTS